MRRTARLIAQLALLPLFVLGAVLDGDVFTVAVAAASAVTWVLSCAVAILLVWIGHVAEVDARRTGVPAPATLNEAADNAVSMALVATGILGAAGYAAGRVLGYFESLGPMFLAVLGWALVLVGVPALSWLRTLREVWLPMLGRLRR